MEAQENYRNALQNGLLKVMSKMGICLVSAYRGSELFEALGLNTEVLEYAFPNTPSRLSGRGFNHLAWNALRLHALYGVGHRRSRRVLQATGPGRVSRHQPQCGAGPPKGGPGRRRGELGSLSENHPATTGHPHPGPAHFRGAHAGAPFGSGVGRANHESLRYLGDVPRCTLQGGPRGAGSGDDPDRRQFQLR